MQRALSISQMLVLLHMGYGWELGGGVEGQGLALVGLLGPCGAHPA